MRAPSLWAALALAACALPLAHADGIPFWPGKEVINVCTSEYTPMVYCVDRETSEYSGYEVALFNRIRPELGWTDSMLNWTCIDWDEMVDSMMLGDGRCDIAVGGIAIGREKLDAGMQFTWPSYKAGFLVMVSAAEQDVHLWAFMDAFTWDLWLAIICTMMAVGLILWAVERWWAAGRRGLDSPADLPSLQDRVFMSMGRPMQTADMFSSSFAGNLIILFFGFMMLILVTLYTANTAANLTATRIQSTIRGVADLPGKAVGTDESYVEDLKRRNINAVGFPWDSVEDEQRMYDALRSGEISALVLDSYALEFEASTQCDLVTVGDTFDDYDQATAFPKGFNNSELIAAYNAALVSLQQSGDMEALAQRYVQPSLACKTRGVSESSTAVSFTQVAGLWVLLACGIAVACALAGAHQLALYSARRMQKQQWYQSSLGRVGRTMRNSMERTGRRLSRGNSSSSNGGVADASLHKGRAAAGFLPGLSCSARDLGIVNAAEAAEALQKDQQA